MRAGTFTAGLAAGLAALALTGLQAPAPARAASPYYVSLGDSLASGDQPDSSGHDRHTSQGYADVVASKGGFRAVKLGCGATTNSLIRGGPCDSRYGAESQLRQAESFLAANRSRTGLVTVNIGDNDFGRCISSRGVDAGCLSAGMGTIQRNLPVIAARLRSAAGPGIPVIGIVDYDEFLAYWLRGASGRRLARTSVSVVQAANRAMASIYWQAGAEVADAGGYFASTDFRHTLRLSGYGRLPKAVARICQWTWACAPGGFDDHANAHGYYVIGEAVLAALDAHRRAAGTTGGTSPS